MPPPASITSSNALDPDVVALAKAVRQTESGGDPTAKGKSGEYGAYQYLPQTWAAQSQAAGVNVPLNQATMEQQNQVWYTWAKKLKDEGYNVGQIASMQNAGEGEPNAYKGTFKNGAPSKGTNKQGVYFDVPGYAEKVATAYHQFKGQGNTPGGGIVPSAQAAGTGSDQTQQPQQEQPLSNRIANFLGFGGTVNTLGDWIAKAEAPNADVASRIETPTVGQDVGAALQLGSLAFPYGRVADAAAGLVGRVAAPAVSRVAGGIAAGGLGGYTQDVAQGLLDKKDAADVLTPGVGTVTGAALGGATSALGAYGSAENKQAKAVTGIQKNIEDVLNGTKSGRQWLADQKLQGNDPVGDLIKAGFVPDVQDSKVSVMPLYESQRQDIVSRLGNLRAAALDAVGKDASLESLYQTAVTPQDAGIYARLKATGNITKIQDETARIMGEYKKLYGDTLSMADLETIKEVNGSLSRRMEVSDPAMSDARKQISLAAQKLIEKRAQESGLPGVDEFNQEIKKYHVTMPELFKKLEGATVKGGRLGNYMRQHSAGLAGGIAGTAVGGGGVVAPIASYIVAEKTMGMLNKIWSDNSIATPAKERLIEQMSREEPDIVKQFLAYVGKQGGDVAPRVTPSAGQGTMGLVSRFVTNTGSRMAAGAQ